MINMEAKKLTPLIAVVGPTASGKTGLGIELAKAYNGEVVSADSMQIYKGMDIATAKPAVKEMQGVVHHLIGFLDCSQGFSVAQYVGLAKTKIQDIYSRGKTPILVGGTGLYINSLLNNVTFSQENSNDEIRRNLYHRLETQGTEVLLNELASYDIQSAQRLQGERNGKRIVRAMEIYMASGRTMTEHMESSMLIPSPYNDVRIGLTCENRENLYNRINNRVDIMVEQGLLDEARKFRNCDCGVTAAKAIGYKELEAYFTGEKTLEQSLDHLKMETRRYAKRQLTWFRRDEKINWIFTDTFQENNQIFMKAADIINNSGILKR